MTDLFKFTHYREYLISIVYHPGTKRGFQVKLAQAMGCQAAYLSQVLKGNSELTEDHALKASEFLELGEYGTEFFVLLVRHARASTPKLRGYLERRRDEIVRESEEIQSRVKSEKPKLDEGELAKYFSTSLPSTIHVATSSDNFQTVESLAKRFQVEESRVREILTFLEGHGLISRDGSRWRYAHEPMHFPRTSPFNIIHQMNHRRQSMQAIESQDERNLHFSSVFTTDRETLMDIRTDLLDYIERSHKKVHASGTSEVYSMSLDLFRSV